MVNVASAIAETANRAPSVRLRISFLPYFRFTEPGSPRIEHNRSVGPSRRGGNRECSQLRLALGRAAAMVLAVAGKNPRSA